MRNVPEEIKAAKKYIKSQIKFLKEIEQNLDSNDDALVHKSLWFAWCLNRYVTNQVINDIKEQAQLHGAQTND